MKDSNVVAVSVMATSYLFRYNTECGNAKGNAIGRRILIMMKEAARLPFASTSDSPQRVKFEGRANRMEIRPGDAAARATQNFTVYRIHRQRAAYQKILHQNVAGPRPHSRGSRTIVERTAEAGRRSG